MKRTSMLMTSVAASLMLGGVVGLVGAVVVVGLLLMRKKKPLGTMD